MRQPGRTVIFSTHITADLERADADIALLREGRMQFTRPLAELRAHLRRVSLRRAGGWPQPPQTPGQLSVSVRGEWATLLVEDADPQALQALALREGASLAIEVPSLEDLFVELA